MSELLTDDCKHRNSGRAKLTIWAHKRGYHVDDEGRIWSFTGRRMNPKPQNNGYVRFSVKRNGITKTVAVHQFVAYDKFGEAALAPGVHVRHMDGNPLNNRRENIEIGTASDNMMDQTREVRVAKARRAASFQRKLSVDSVVELRRCVANGTTITAAAKSLGLSKGTVSMIVNRITYKDVP